jgi:hypothetical protein
MKRIFDKLLFILVPFFGILLFISSGEQIIPLFRNTILEECLYVLSFPNTIVFNLSIGYLSGVFVYYLTGYIPTKRMEQHHNIITSRLLSQINSRINSLIRTIIKCSTCQVENLDNIEEDLFLVICDNCELDSPTGSKKIISYNPFQTGDTLLRESVINDWNFILSHLNEIDNAAFYVKPEYYILCQRIRKSALAYTIKDLDKPLKNKSLGSWGSQLYDLYLIGKEIDGVISIIGVK